MAKREEFYYDSRDMVTKIHAVKWLPETDKPRAVVQLVHGMTEHILRYDEFANALCERGFLVIGSDHLGHGLSKREEEPYGYFCKRDAATVVVRDVHRLKKIIQEQYPGVPFFLLGHSMGSFIVRCYLARYGTGIDGAVIVGTGSQPPAMTKGCRALVRFQALFLGWRHKAKMVDRLAFGKYNERFEPCRTEKDWVSRNKENVDAYIADPLCGFCFTLNGYATLMRLVETAGRKETAAAVPKELPVLFLAGAEDPVGDYGKGVRQAYESFRDSGVRNVSMKLYEGDRHEILNEEDRQEVYGDVIAFVEKYAKSAGGQT